MTQFLRSPCPLHRLQRTFAVLQRALPGGFCKAGGKIAGIPKAYLLCNFADAVIGEDKQFLCLCDVEVDQIIIRCRAHIPPEQPQKIAFAHVRLCQQVGKAKFLLVIFAQGLRCLQNDLPCAGGFSLCKNALRTQRQHLVESQSGGHHAVHGAEYHMAFPLLDEPRTTQGIKQKISGCHLGTARSVCLRPGL